jgi:hypothetical protein
VTAAVGRVPLIRPTRPSAANVQDTDAVREAPRAPAAEGAPVRSAPGPEVSNHALAALLGRPGPFEVGDTPSAERDAARATATSRPPGVRIHTGPLADRATAEAGTVAVTHDAHIVLSTLVTQSPLTQRNRVLAHELAHAQTQALSGRPVMQRFGEALTSSMTAQTAASMDDTTLQSELYDASRALSNPGLPPAERTALRNNHDLLESEVRRRSLATAVPAAGGQEYTIASVGFSDDPEHARYALETMVTVEGTEATDRTVREMQSLTTDTGKQIAWINYQNDYTRAFEPKPEPTFPPPAVAYVVARQWAILKAENVALIKEATTLGNALMAESLAHSRQQAESEAERYGWVSDAQGWTVRRTDSFHLDEEKRLGSAAAELTAKHEVVDDTSGRLASLQSHLNESGESDMALAESLSAQMSEAESQLAAARADLITAELALSAQFPVLVNYVSENDWDDLADLAADPTGWDYGGRIKGTLLDIVKVQNALAEGETSCWKQDRIVELMRRYQDVPDGSMRARLYQEAVADAHDDPWWKKALTVVAIGLSILAAIPTGGGSVLVTGVVLTAEGAGAALDLYLLHDALGEYSLAKAATGTDLDVARAVSAKDPSAVWLVVQILATGIGTAGAVKSVGRITEARAAIRAAKSSEEAAEATARLRNELDELMLPEAAKQRTMNEAALYPGIRPELAARPSAAPLEGMPVGVTGQKWTVRNVKPEEIKQVTVKGETYWEFPELQVGEVLVFPSGYRVWKQPGGAIVEETLVTTSVSGSRSLTRGEGVLHPARDMGPEHVAAGTQRSHGAGAPGLGFDAPYGVAHAPKQVNLVLENMGLEQFMRDLRDNASDGVQYLYRTTTYKAGSNLTERVYRISAAVDNEVHDMYEFAIRMKPGAGLGDEAVEFVQDEVEAFSGATRYGANINPPKPLRRAMERVDRGAKEVADKLVVGTGEKVESLLSTVEQVERRIAAKGDVAGMEALNELTERLQQAEDMVKHGAVDRGRFEALSEVVSKFNKRAARWSDKVSTEDIKAFLKQLNSLFD